MADPKFMQDNQILLEQVADVTMDMYAAESAYLRTQKMIEDKGEEACKIPIALTQILVYERMRHTMEIVRQICANVAGDDEAEFAPNRKAMQRLSFDYALDTMRMKSAIVRPPDRARRVLPQVIAPHPQT